MTSDSSNICIYLVEGDDDEEALKQVCHLKRPCEDSKTLENHPLWKVSKTLEKIEGILGKYRRITSQNMKSTIKKYIDKNSSIILIAKFSQTASYNQVAIYIKEKKALLQEMPEVRCIFFIFDCDAPADRCNKFYHVSSILGCAKSQPCCISTLHGICEKIHVLALAPRLENAKLCNCACCNSCTTPRP